MKVIVKPHNLSIDNADDFNKGEYNIQSCEFEFSEEYTDDFVKVALFTNENNKTYKQEIERNFCDVPPEILKNIGRVILGIYAYKAENGKVVKRYSPDPDRFVVLNGSYIEDTENSKPITPSEMEQYEQILHNYIQEINNTLKSAEEELEKTIQVKEDTEQVKKDTEDLYDKVKKDYDNKKFIPNIKVGTVETLDPDKEAIVDINGSKEEPIIDFGIPKGPKGNCFYAVPYIDVETGIMMLDVTDDTDYITFDVTDNGYLEAIIGE